MIINGIDVSALPPQIVSATPGTTLILDGDGPAYVAAATVKRLDTAIRRLQTTVLTEMFLAGCTHARVHLTAKDSYKRGRFEVNAVKPYQGQRDSKAKPALLEPLRMAMSNSQNWLPEFCVFLHYDIEADDAMMCDAYIYRELGVMRSDDKDLRMTPFPYMDKDTGVKVTAGHFGKLYLKEMPSGIKLLGNGPLFFFAQMLMGDSADNIKGILKYDGKLCGPAAAYNALKDCEDIHEAANTVISGYRSINQNPIPEAYLLWLPRHEEDHVLEYLVGLALTHENKEFLHDCINRPWYSA